MLVRCGSVGTGKKVTLPMITARPGRTHDGACARIP
jgi:hypothetical protein